MPRVPGEAPTPDPLDTLGKSSHASSPRRREMEDPLLQRESQRMLEILLGQTRRTPPEAHRRAWRSDMPGTVQACSEQCGVEEERGAFWQEEARALFPSGRLELLLQDFVVSPEALPGGHTHLSTCHLTRPSVTVHVRLCGNQPAEGLDCASFISILRRIDSRRSHQRSLQRAVSLGLCLEG